MFFSVIHLNISDSFKSCITLLICVETVTWPVPPGVRSSTFSSMFCVTPSWSFTTDCLVVVFTIVGVVLEVKIFFVFEESGFITSRISFKIVYYNVKLEKSVGRSDTEESMPEKQINKLIFESKIKFKRGEKYFRIATITKLYEILLL